MIQWIVIGILGLFVFILSVIMAKMNTNMQILANSILNLGKNQLEVVTIVDDRNTAIMDILNQVVNPTDNETNNSLN